jgi:hypothetical protein
MVPEPIIYSNEFQIYALKEYTGGGDMTALTRAFLLQGSVVLFRDKNWWPWVFQEIEVL